MLDQHAENTLAAAIMRYVTQRFQADNRSVRPFPLTQPFSLNNMFATTRSGRVKTKEYLAWRTLQMHEIMVSPMSRRPISTQVDVVLCLPATAADTDNCAKAYLDALQEMGILMNDNQVRHVILLRLGAEGQGFLLLNGDDHGRR